MAWGRNALRCSSAWKVQGYSLTVSPLLRCFVDAPWLVW
uniref:Uncharacterized protein n=1 Tax=Arundo donax TaxID=35708 RepID=A0A0A9BVU4_ARUDO